LALLEMVEPQQRKEQWHSEWPVESL
jgi:hypothetical protein